MSNEALFQKVIEATPKSVSKSAKIAAYVMIALGVIGLIIGFFGGVRGGGWTALLVSGSLLLGLGMFGPVLSAIFQLTGAKWGRAYRRMAEASVVFMPLGVLALLAMLLGGNSYLPWVGEEHLSGGKHIWLIRGFWDARMLVYVALPYGLGLAFVYYSLRRDFCLQETAAAFKNRLAEFVAKNIKDPEAEKARCDEKLSVLAPILLIVYAVCFTFIAFDLIMALEPDWFSTLFGAWHFIGHIFSGLAWLAVVSLLLKARLPLEGFLTQTRQRDLATLLFAFTLVNTDFFWNQFLTIWYANMPEETFYIIKRSYEGNYAALSKFTLAAFFIIPFIALLFRKVKHSGALLSIVASFVILGIFLARFIEIAPPILNMGESATFSDAFMPLFASIFTYAGFLGAGFWLYNLFLTKAPIMPIGDDVFVKEFSKEEAH